jgi:hypothetical protein
MGFNRRKMADQLNALLADDWRRDPRALLVSLGTLPSVPNNLSNRLRTLDRHREAAVTSLIPQFLPERSPPGLESNWIPTMGKELYLWLRSALHSRGSFLEQDVQDAYS